MWSGMMDLFGSSTCIECVVLSRGLCRDGSCLHWVILEGVLVCFGLDLQTTVLCVFVRQKSQKRFVLTQSLCRVAFFTTDVAGSVGIGVFPRSCCGWDFCDSNHCYTLECLCFGHHRFVGTSCSDVLLVGPWFSWIWAI